MVPQQMSFVEKLSLSQRVPYRRFHCILTQHMYFPLIMIVVLADVLRVYEWLVCHLCVQSQLRLEQELSRKKVSVCTVTTVQCRKVM